MKKYLCLKNGLMVSIMMTSCIQSSSAAPLDIATIPLFLGSSGSRNSNVFFMVDDSASMDWDILRSTAAQHLEGGNIEDSGFRKTIDFNGSSLYEDRAFCYGYNVMAYNPNITYTPWDGLRDNGTPYPQADIYHIHQSVNSSPYLTNTSTGSAYNDPYIPWHDLDSDGEYDYGECVENNHAFRPRDTNQCRSRYATPYHSGTPNASLDSWCQLVHDLPADQQQNYANWREYYHRRRHSTKRVLSSVITKMTTNAAFDTINRNAYNQSARPPTLMQDMNIQAKKNALLQALFETKDEGGTPLRRALKEIGKYYTTAHEDGEMGDSPIVGDAGECQGNYAILFTDGQWRGGTPDGKGYYSGTHSLMSDGVPIKNEDGDDNTAFDGAAHADNQEALLADVAMKYYETDLAPDLPNNGTVIPGVDENPAQHMVTYIVSFGVKGSLSAPPGFGDTSFNWPHVTDSSPSTLDDALHAAYNGRGKFVSAANPDELDQAFKTIIADISQRSASSASFGTNTNKIENNSKLYQVSLNSRYWSGDLVSYPLLSGGEIDVQNPDWKASENMPAFGQRIIITTDDYNSVPFRWNNLTTLKTALNSDEKLMNYIRGDKSHEMAQDANTAFRDRPLTVLGDIADSKPVYLGAPSGAYTDTSYSSFKASYNNRTPMIFTGANDGMLHAFNADTGQEAFAYIPGAVQQNLKDLADSSYAHHFYVDGTVTVADAYSNGYWHSVLVGGLNAGGKGVYALDVTDVANDYNTETGAANEILWDLSDNDDSDLGLTYSQPDIGQLQDGTWVAIFGNGYNNTGTGHAVLYIVNLFTGNMIAKIDTQSGTTSTPNGLSTATLFDKNDDNKVDYVYAGDLAGHLWKFDLTGSISNNCCIANSGQSLFTTPNNQPITGSPQVIKHPSQTGYMVYFGTGRYLQQADNASSAIQSFYGIWDKNDNSVVNFNALKQRKILADTTAFGLDVRVTSGLDDSAASGGGSIDWATQRGWYIDFDTISGEMQITKPIVRNKEIIFTTLIPDNSNACSAGGDGRLMALDQEQGTRPKKLFDINGSGSFNDDAVTVTIDGVEKSVSVSAVGFNIGIASSPTLLDKADETSTAYMSGTDGTAHINLNKGATIVPGRRISWRQLFL